MHVGRTYPYMHDLWACSSQFWPGFVPRCVFLDFQIGQPYPWDELSGLSFATFDGIVNATREIVDYPCPLFGSWTSLTFRIQTAFPGGIKATVLSMFGTNPLHPSPANAISDPFPTPQYGISCNSWPNGSSVLPNVVYVPPLLSARPALWAEV